MNSASMHKCYVTHIQPQNGEKQNIYLEVIYQKDIYPASMFMKPFADSVHPVSVSGIVRGKPSVPRDGMFPRAAPDTQEPLQQSAAVQRLPR